MILPELFRFTVEMFRPPKTQTVSQWADENRVLVSESSSEPGPWKTDRAPYQREIMDAFTDPDVQEIVIKASAQVGKSEIELNMMGRAIDLDPGPMLYIQPTEAVAEDYSTRRIAPMIEHCPVLKMKIFSATGRDSRNTIGMKTFPGGSLAIIGANSPSDLASKPVRYIFMDEIDRFPDSAGTEGDPIALAEKRTLTFAHNKKIVKTSTPTNKGTSKIEKAYMRGTQEEWHTQCPHCEEYAFIRFDDVKFDHESHKDENGDTIYLVDNVRWKCPNCGQETGEHDMKRQPAKWVAKNERALENGVRSFWLNAFMSPWASWKKICLEFLEAKDDPEKLKVWHNTVLGECWEMRDVSGMPEKLYDRREHYNAEIPTGVLVLTMGIDTQDNRLEYEVVGWNRHEESWGISKGIIPGRADSPGVWEEVDALLDREWKMKNGMKMRIIATFVDSGGHFTQDVYRECAKRQNRLVFAIKGEGGTDKPYVRMMKSGGRNDATRFMIGVDSGKEGIMYAMTVDKPGPKYMHFPMDYRAGYDREYFKGLCSERLVLHRRGGKSVPTWEKVHERNEPLDLRNYNRAVFRYFHWDFDKLERTLRGEKPEPKLKAETPKKKTRRVISSGVKV